MLSYASKRVVIGILTLLAASIIVFAVLEVVPGDPARLMLGMNATEDAVRALQDQMGFNQPLILRYFSWLGDLLTGDFGKSYTYSVPVIDLIKERIAVSLPLALISLALSTIIAIPIGIFAASRRGSTADTTAMGIAQVGVAIPNFWFALLLVYIFAVVLRLLPAGGFAGCTTSFRHDLPGLYGICFNSVEHALPY